MSSPTFRPTPAAGSGTGDMTKAVYDTDDSGVVDDSTLWDGEALPEIADATGGQVLALKSDKSALEFATVSGGASAYGDLTDIPAAIGAIDGLTPAADKIPYYTAADAGALADLTEAARTLLDDTTTAAMLTTLSAASSTTAAMSIYVDKAATGAGTGVDWTNAFTTIQAAVDSLPAIINHAVTIYVRKGSTPYRETVTVQRVIAAGSLTVRGEFYHTFEAASNSTANRLVKNASDDFTDVEVGDQVTLIQFSGAFDATYPSGGYYGTVTNVDNKASGYVTISMDASVTPTTGWRYIITKTVIDGSDDGTTPVRDYCLLIKSPCNINGLSLVLPLSYAVYVDTACVGNVALTCLNMICGSNSGISITRSTATNTTLLYFSIIKNTTRLKFGVLGYNGSFNISTGLISGMSYSSGLGQVHASGRCSGFVSYCIIKSIAVDDGPGASIYGMSYCEFQRVSIYGLNSSNKLATGVFALQGSVGVTNAGNIDSTTVTTAKTPANWAATTDGSVIL